MDAASVLAAIIEKEKRIKDIKDGNAIIETPTELNELQSK
jgi:hypothetical protein